jgi:VWFA-related protein
MLCSTKNDFDRAQPQCKALVPLVALLILSSSASPITRAQSASAAERILVNVKLVQMDCIVEDRYGSPIHGLTPKDFDIKEEGHSVPVRYLRTDHDVPLSVALLVDVSLSQNGMLPIYADAVRSLKSELTPGRDRVSIFTFGHSIALLSDWQDAALLEPARIENLTPQAGTVLVKGSRFLRGGTLLFDAMSKAVSRIQDLEGRKAILVLSDGVDEGSKTLSATVAHDAQLANVSVSALEFEPHGILGHLPSPGLVMKSAYDGLSRISNGTGGVFLHAEHGKEQQQMQDIVELLKEQYILEFTPLGSQPGFHSVTVSVASKDARVRTRKQFYEH